MDALQDEQKIKTKLEMLDGKSIELKEINEPKIQVDGHLNEAVYTRLVDSTGPIRSFKNIFIDGYQYPFKNLFVVKLRYRFGS